jgi:alkanesulfonate monooxygenase SsuD/methylene tetrahydromethanopterin reductase-like flavin-dependent oxidoreductase (luciferase family)
MAGQTPEYRAMLDREGASGPQDVAIVGSERTVAQHVEQLRDAGVTEFMAAPYGSDEEQRRTAKLLVSLAG